MVSKQPSNLVDHAVEDVDDPSVFPAFPTFLDVPASPISLDVHVYLVSLVLVGRNCVDSVADLTVLLAVVTPTACVELSPAPGGWQ